MYLLLTQLLKLVVSDVLCVSGRDRVSGGAGEEAEAGRRGSAGPGERPEHAGTDQRERREDEGGCESAEE